jgi:hypothetical protein
LLRGQSWQLATTQSTLSIVTLSIDAYIFLRTYPNILPFPSATAFGTATNLRSIHLEECSLPEMFQHLFPLLNANRNLWVIVGQHRHVVNFEIDCGLAGWRNLPTRVTRRSLVAGIVGQTLQRFSKTGPRCGALHLSNGDRIINSLCRKKRAPRLTDSCYYQSVTMA